MPGAGALGAGGVCWWRVLVVRVLVVRVLVVRVLVARVLVVRVLVVRVPETFAARTCSESNPKQNRSLLCGLCPSAVSFLRRSNRAPPRAQRPTSATPDERNARRYSAPVSTSASTIPAAIASTAPSTSHVVRVDAGGTLAAGAPDSVGGNFCGGGATPRVVAAWL